MLNHGRPVHPCWSAADRSREPTSKSGSREPGAGSTWPSTDAPARSPPFVGPTGCSGSACDGRGRTGNRPCGRSTRYSHRLASSGSCVVLDTPVASARRPPAGRRRRRMPDPGDGRREPTVGRAAHPWRIVEVGVVNRRSRAHHAASDSGELNRGASDRRRRAGRSRAVRSKPPNMHAPSKETSLWPIPDCGRLRYGRASKGRRRAPQSRTIRISVDGLGVSAVANRNRPSGVTS